MREMSRRISLRESASSFAVPIGRDQLVETLLEFLAWIEKSRGLKLCEAFKPQYDWYMPVILNKEKLAQEFLAKKASSSLARPKLETVS